MKGGEMNLLELKLIVDAAVDYAESTHTPLDEVTIDVVTTNGNVKQLRCGQYASAMTGNPRLYLK